MDEDSISTQPSNSDDSFTNSSFEFSSLMSSFTCSEENETPECSASDGENKLVRSPLFAGKTPKVAVLPFVKPKVLFPPTYNMDDFDFNPKDPEVIIKTTHKATFKNVHLAKNQVPLAISDHTAACENLTDQWGKNEKVCMLEKPQTQASNVHKRQKKVEQDSSITNQENGEATEAEKVPKMPIIVKIRQPFASLNRNPIKR